MSHLLHMQKAGYIRLLARYILNTVMLKVLTSIRSPKLNSDKSAQYLSDNLKTMGTVAIRGLCARLNKAL